MGDLSYAPVHKDTDQVLEALENFMLRFPDLDRGAVVFRPWWHECRRRVLDSE